MSEEREDGISFDDPRIVETVDNVTGQRIKVRGHTQESLRKALREAPVAAGRDPLLVGLRTRGMTPEQRSELMQKVAKDPGLKLISRAS